MFGTQTMTNSARMEKIKYVLSAVIGMTVLSITVSMNRRTQATITLMRRRIMNNQLTLCSIEELNAEIERRKTIPQPLESFNTDELQKVCQEYI